MTLPAHIRTWHFQVGQLIAAQGTQALMNKALLWAIKESLKGNGSWTDSAGAAVASAGNWVVRSSSDGVGGFGNNDNVDRWATQANIIWAAGVANHSWIVLEQAGIPGAVGNLQICIDCHYAVGTEYNVDIWTSVSANFGSLVIGSATAAPTATDQQQLNAAVGSTATALRWGGPDGNCNNMLQVMKTSDGTATRVLVQRCANNGSGAHTVAYWAFELPLATTAWTTPSACIVQAVSGVTPSGNVDLMAGFGGSQVTWSRIPGGANFSSSWTALGTASRGEFLERWGGDASQICINSIGGTEPMCQVGLYSSTVNSRGRNGRFVDLYQGVQINDSSQSGNTSRTVPATGTLRQWCKFGAFYHPWNQSVPLVIA